MEQHTFTLMGDPANLGAHIDKFLKANPLVRITTMTAAPWMYQPNDSSGILTGQKAVPVHVLYVVCEGTITETADTIKN